MRKILVAVDGATITCSATMGPITSIVEGTCDVEATGCNGSILTEHDREVDKNIIPFTGMCKRRPFPQFMPLTHLPCRPIITQKWKKTAKKAGNLDGRIVTENSCINCQRGGLIEIENTNQTQIHIGIADGDSVTLVFDGEQLVAIDNKIGRVVARWDAVSGNLLDGKTQPELSAKEGEGPIPEGKYTVNPQDSNRDNFVKSLPGRFPIVNRWDWGDNDDWGDVRTVIDPQEGTDLLGREPSTMYFHGGDDPGSAGCVDLTSGNNDFHDWLADFDGAIEVVVDYPDYGDDTELLASVNQSITSTPKGVSVYDLLQPSPIATPSTTVAPSPGTTVLAPSDVGEDSVSSPSTTLPPNTTPVPNPGIPPGD